MVGAGTAVLTSCRGSIFAATPCQEPPGRSDPSRDLTASLHATGAVAAVLFAALALLVFVLRPGARAEARAEAPEAVPTPMRV